MNGERIECERCCYPGGPSVPPGWASAPVWKRDVYFCPACVRVILAAWLQR